MKQLSSQAFSAVTRLFHSVSGIRLTEAKHALVTGRLQRLASEAGEPDVETYVERLLRGGAPAQEMQRLIDRLTTNETYFFREPQHFNHLADRLPRVPAGQQFNVWSAASSSGEEAYSVAMLLSDQLAHAPWQVIGTDLSVSMVESARCGLYTFDRARMVPETYLKRFCLKGQGAQTGQVLLERSLRAKVRFEPANLMQPLPDWLPQFDVIFLRNVLIYFDNEAKAEIVRRVLGRLKPGGVLYIGHAESLSNLGLPLRMLATAVHTHA
ncbi:MAG TPA: CheR family methyltransferase [Aquabacterium sp.]|mgnify:FL=1|nr:CheR family methyltransferase [Aquabacterium sp.]